ncbi:unnamed protein product [Arctia plantaginis]|uniref:Uncharacterized protein n=1 Tax=Arctia plantaginis TaxID=874455 RepID=A0A8S1AGB3_ARCPL|nr:unnamed protein product [Arctia plantaginis]
MAQRYKDMIFDNRTTTRHDYRSINIKPCNPTTYKPKERYTRPQPHTLKDMHSLTDYKCPCVPFTLYHKPKEILQTNPRNIQEIHETLEDHEREEVQRTRPRVCLSPAIALDDVEESARHMIVTDMYTTSAMQATKESVMKTLAATNANKAPLSNVYAPPKMITLPHLLKLPYVSPEWRMDSMSFDARQLRTDFDRTEAFWLDHNSTCGECKDTAARKARQNLLTPC